MGFQLEPPDDWRFRLGDVRGRRGDRESAARRVLCRRLVGLADGEPGGGGRCEGRRADCRRALMNAVEVNFDGLVGPTHNYGGLAQGNLAAAANEGSVSNPREAALQGLSKMRALVRMGLTQGCLLYTSDAADERSSVDLGGRRIIKKTKRARITHRGSAEDKKEKE